MSAYTYEMVRENSRLPVHFAYIQGSAHTILAHWHEYLEILLIVSGGMTAVIQAETYQLSAGDILIINSKVYQKEEDGYPLLFTARLHDLLYCLYRYDSHWLAPDSQKAAHRDISRITQTMDWVGEHYRESLTLDEAAGNLGLSREYFCRIFRKYTGQTFLEYLNTVRVMRFHDEMIYSNDSITNLMAAHGISNYKIFLRTYKKIYGDTPQKMRK